MPRQAVPEGQRARNAGISLPPGLIRGATRFALARRVSLSAFTKALLQDVMLTSGPRGAAPLRVYELRHRLSPAILWRGEAGDLQAALFAAMVAGVDLASVDLEEHLRKEGAREAVRA